MKKTAPTAHLPFDLIDLWNSIFMGIFSVWDLGRGAERESKGRGEQFLEKFVRPSCPETGYLRRPKQLGEDAGGMGREQVPGVEKTRNDTWKWWRRGGCGSRERNRPSGRKARKQMGQEEDAESICKKKAWRGKEQKIRGSSTLPAGFLCLFPLAEGDHEWARGTAWFLCLGSSTLMLSSLNPSLQLILFLHLAEMKLNKWPCDGVFHEDFIQHTHTASAGLAEYLA